MGSVPEELAEECAQRPSAAELWDYFDQRFSAQSLTSVSSLWVRLFQLRLDDYPGVSAYLTALTKIELELQRAGQVAAPSLLAGAILTAMGDRYPTTRELLFTLPIAQQTKAVFALRLLEAEKNAKVSADMAAMTTGGAPRKGPALAPAAEANAAGSRPSGPLCNYVRKFQGKGLNSVPGTVCGRRHLKPQNCWAKLDDAWMVADPGKTAADLPNRRLEYKQEQTQQRQGANAAVLTPQQVAVLQQALAASASVSSGSSDVSDKFEEGSFLGYLYADRDSIGNAPELCEVETTSASIIVALDSGATSSCFKQGADFRPLKEPVTVRGALPGLTSLAKGTTCLPCPALPSGQLRGLHSPDFRHNLVSVSELQSQGVEVVFPACAKSAHCKDPSTGEILWTFQQGQLGLYEAKLREQTAASAVKHSAPDLHPTTLLHRRLGHIGESSLRTLISKQAILGLPQSYTPPPVPFPTGCLPCIQSKTQAVPHPLHRSRCSTPLDKVHVDLVGPLPSGVRGHRYWMTVVDDCTRYGWSIMLHSKDQAKHKFIEWQAQVERQSGLKLKHFHSDRGSEFLNDILLTHFREQGVSCSFSNPHSPQQNGVAEARNKQVGRFTRSLLLHSHAPQSYWSYAVRHATVLNNLLAPPSTCTQSFATSWCSARSLRSHPFQGGS